MLQTITEAWADQIWLAIGLAVGFYGIQASIQFLARTAGIQDDCPFDCPAVNPAVGAQPSAGARPPGPDRRGPTARPLGPDRRGPTSGARPWQTSGPDHPSHRPSHRPSLEIEKTITSYQAIYRATKPHKYARVSIEIRFPL